jgi:hypothetical protein
MRVAGVGAFSTAIGYEVKESFFSEEKNQKTFVSGAHGEILAHWFSYGASIVGVSET